MDALTLITFLLVVFVALSLFTDLIPNGLWLTGLLTLIYLCLALVGFAKFGLVF